jgi:uncharacterized protein (DUF488 family)
LNAVQEESVALPGLFGANPVDETMKLFTIGYGGRTPTEFVRLLVEHGVRTIADVRLHPGRAYMACFAKAKSPDKGIERILREAGIGYASVIGLGNPFKDEADWPERYRGLLTESGETLIEPLLLVPRPFCLLCAEKKPEQCHRKLIADYLQARGWEVHHIQ